MVDFLNTWTQRIIVVVIICTIIEMILPEGKNKKYIKTVAGIYVVFTIIGPIISKINTKQSLNLEKFLKTKEQNVIETSVNLDNNKYIEEVYKEKIGADIKNKIEALGYQAKLINLEIETKDEKTYGSILELNISLGPKEEKEDNRIKIDPVVIGKETVKEETKISPEEIEKIKKYLGEIYYLDKEKIIIK